MRLSLTLHRHLACWTPCYQWDRLNVWLLWVLKVEVDRAWLDDRQYNPLNWLRVVMWRYRHPIWVNRIGFRIDRFLFDRKLGFFWLSRLAGGRSRTLWAFPAYRRACKLFEARQ